MRDGEKGICDVIYNSFNTQLVKTIQYVRNSSIKGKKRRKKIFFQIFFYLHPCTRKIKTLNTDRLFFSNKICI